MNAYYNDLKQFLKNKVFIFVVLADVLMSFGFAMTNLTLSIDDLEGVRYVGAGNELIASGRFGTVLWSYVFGYRDRLIQNSFIIDCVSLALFVFAVINFCVLFRRISKSKISMSACMVFSCIWLSYPLINEIWEYTGTNIVICGGFLLISLTLLLIHNYVHSENKRKYSLLVVAAILMMIVCAGYEAVVPVYIFAVCAVLSLQIVYGDENEKQLKNVIYQGLFYASILIAGILLRVLIHKVILVVMGVPKANNGATTIYWGKGSINSVLKNWFIGTMNTVLDGIIYFPLTELLVSMVVLVVVGIIACRRHSWVLVIPGCGMFLSLIILSLIQGVVSPYRTCQVYGIFVAFVGMIVVVIIQQRKWKYKKWIPLVSLILAGCLCFYQAVYLNYFLTLNHIRSEEEANVIRQTGEKLQAEFDTTKPVIFIGRYQLSEYVREAASISKDDLRWKLHYALYMLGNQLVGGSSTGEFLSRKLPQTNINSILAWGEYAHNQEAMHNLFMYYGFDYVLAEYETVYEEAREYVIQNEIPSYPEKGYIIDAGDYIVVCMGKIH